MDSQVRSLLNDLGRALVGAGATPQEARHLAITTYLREAIRRGVPFQTAWDAVFGDGSYTDLVGDVYDGLRAKARAS